MLPAKAGKGDGASIAARLCRSQEYSRRSSTPALIALRQRRAAKADLVGREGAAC